MIKRTALARALVRGPEIMFFDEPKERFMAMSGQVAAIIGISGFIVLFFVIAQLIDCTCNGMLSFLSAQKPHRTRSPPPRTHSPLLAISRPVRRVASGDG